MTWRRPCWNNATTFIHEAVTEPFCRRLVVANSKLGHPNLKLIELPEHARNHGDGVTRLSASCYLDFLFLQLIVITSNQPEFTPSVCVHLCTASLSPWAESHFCAVSLALSYHASKKGLHLYHHKTTALMAPLAFWPWAFSKASETARKGRQRDAQFCEAVRVVFLGG